MQKQQRLAILVVLVVTIAAASFALLATSGGGEDSKKTIRFGYVAWDGEIASTHVLTKVLEEAGYKVEMVNVDAGVLYQGLADGELDITTSAWLPVTQKNYWDTYGAKIDSVSTNLEGCTVGLAVPTYMTDVNSIGDLANYSSQLDGRIVGIDPGAGMMAITEDVVVEYGLSPNIELMASSSAGMLAELTKAYADREWIVVTLWTPHYAFDKWELKMLEDPLGLYGGAEHVETLARQGFAQDNPDANAIIGRFSWTLADIQGVMLDIANGMDEEAAAQKWIDAHRDTVDYWLTGQA